MGNNLNNRDWTIGEDIFMEEEKRLRRLLEQQRKDPKKIADIEKEKAATRDRSQQKDQEKTENG